jgi:hypothetical protein
VSPSNANLAPGGTVKTASITPDTSPGAAGNQAVSITTENIADHAGAVDNPLFPALRSAPTAVSGASRQKQIPSSHYLTNGTIAGTVIILKGSGLDESNIQPLLSALDDEFLPDVDLEHGNLTYTVVLGEVLGNWEAEKPSMGA